MKGIKIKMGAIDEIIRIIRMGPQKLSELNSIKINNKSVVAGANDATFQFSCFVSNTTPTDYATTISSLCDRKYAAMTQTWISLHPFMDISIDKSPMSYLKRLHQNMKFESTDNDDDYMIENCYNGERVVYRNRDDSIRVIFEGTDKLSNNLIKNHRENLIEYLSDFNINPVPTFEDDGSSFGNSYDAAQAIIAGRVQNNRHKRNNDNMSNTSKNHVPKLTDREMKRANNMLPYGIEVRLIAKNENNEFVQYIDFIVGVKTILHLVDSDDCIDNILRTLQNKSVFFKFIRWRTGEISLMKNLILDLENIKLDAADRELKNNPYFSVLRRMKHRRFKLKDLTVPYMINPSATFVITSYEVDYILNNYGIDIREVRNAIKLKEALFLMSFIIIDESSATIDILDDGMDTFQTHALETLERENSLSSNKLGREIGRMISH